MTAPARKPSRRRKQTPPPPGRRYSIGEARNQLAKLVHKSEEGGPVEITRRGQPVAVLLSLADYQRMTGAPGLFERIQRFRATHDLDALDAEAAFEPVRDRSAARPFNW